MDMRDLGGDMPQASCCPPAHAIDTERVLNALLMALWRRQGIALIIRP
ncbi:putative transposase, IS3/IS911 family [Variovorax paradoxus B4]|uniref:Putative transposase, IS3/IS911 family n=1 Tax=Variovorax paradoxus B4 TaxID=1246301 RepID=T1XL44_VARPD|nr:putative transposase, IS3/IS911 family [Variovorax paradoxus B4]